MITERRKLAIWIVALVAIAIIHEAMAASLASGDPLAQILVGRDLTTAMIAGALFLLRMCLVFIVPGLIVYRALLAALRLTKRAPPSSVRP